jgi:hypothetical protein
MLIEDLLLAGAIGLVALLAGWPFLKLLKTAPWKRRNPLAQAQERLRAAKLEAEAARLHREADRIYEDIYRDALAGDQSAPAREEPRSIEQVEEERSPEEAPPEQPEKGKAQ